MANGIQFFFGGGGILEVKWSKEAEIAKHENEEEDDGDEDRDRKKIQI